MKRIKAVFGKIKNWISLWPDSWSLPLILVAFWVSIPIIRWIDPTSGIFDTGVFQLSIIVAFLISSLNLLIFLGIEFNFPIIWDWYKKGIIGSDWLKLTPWQRFLFFSLLYFGLLLSVVILAISLI